jgi:hypothetical protein
MLEQALKTMKPEHTHELAARGIPHTRISEWKAKRALPTRTQTFALAEVRGLNFDELEREIVLLELEHKAKKNKGCAQMLQRAKEAWRDVQQS